MAIFRQRTFSPETRQGIMGTAGSATTQRGLLMAFDDAASAENRMQIDMKNGGSVFSNRINANNAYAAQLWNRAFYTFEAAAVTDAIKGYVGGVLVAQSGAQLAVPSVLDPSNTLFLGNNATGNFLDGELAEVVCYSSVLTTEERAALDVWAECIETDEPHGPMPLPTLAASTTICLPSEQPCRIGVMGDSITSTTSPATWINGYMRTAYPTSVSFRNVAVSSTTIEIAKTNQWQNDLRTSGVHSIMMLIGTNDVNAGTSAADILADIDEVADAAISLNMKVITVSILPREASLSLPGYLAVLLDVNTGLAAAADGVIRIHADVYADMEDPVLTDDLLTAYDSGDHLHPNQTGQDALGAFIDSLIVVE
jgi:lysophospholipase L1-like esterase